jgi:hypothetical protein
VRRAEVGGHGADAAGADAEGTDAVGAAQGVVDPDDHGGVVGPQGEPGRQPASGRVPRPHPAAGEPDELHGPVGAFAGRQAGPAAPPPVGGVARALGQ